MIQFQFYWCRDWRRTLISKTKVLIKIMFLKTVFVILVSRSFVYSKVLDKILRRSFIKYFMGFTYLWHNQVYRFSEWFYIVYKLRVLGHFTLHFTPPPWDTFWSGALGHFVLKNQTRKIDEIHKDFLTISSIPAAFFFFSFFCQNVQVFSNYILLARKINTFQSGSVSSIHKIKSLCSKMF